MIKRNESPALKLWRYTLAGMLALVLTVGFASCILAADEAVAMEAQGDIAPLAELKKTVADAQTAYDYANELYTAAKGAYDDGVAALADLEERAANAATPEEAEEIYASADYVYAYTNVQNLQWPYEDAAAKWLDAKEKLEAAKKALNNFTDFEKNPGISASVRGYTPSYNGYSRIPDDYQLCVVYTDAEGKEYALTVWTDFLVDYENNVEIGTATAHFTGTGDWRGSLSATYEIVKGYSRLTLYNYEEFYYGGPLEYCGYMDWWGSEGDLWLHYYTDPECTQEIDPDDVVDPGEYHVIAVLDGDEHYYGRTSNSALFTIYPGFDELRLEPQSRRYTGKPVKYTGELTRLGDKGTIKYHYYSDAKCTNELQPADVVNTGTYYVTAELIDNVYYYNCVSDPAKFTIVPGKSSIKLTAQSKTYTGKALKYSGKVTRSGSAGRISYTYYSDSACTKKVAAANVLKAGTYYVKARLAADSNSEAATSAAVKFTISKASNTLSVKAASKKIKYSKVKAKAVTAAPLTVSGGQGIKSYKVAAWTTAKAKTCFKVNSSTGKVTAKKGTPKGTYKFQVKVTAKGNTNYKGTSKTVNVKIVVS